MKKATVLVMALLTAFLFSLTAHAGKIKTGTEDGNVFTDARHGFTFQKNENWKFKFFDENPARPEGFRFRLQKAIYQVPAERQFARDTWTPAYGGFYIDTTSMDLEQFKTLLVTLDRKNKLRETVAKQAEIIREGLVADTKRTNVLGKLGSGYQITFKQEYAAQTKDVRGNYNVITDHLMGDLYLTIAAGKVYMFFFTAERAEYRLVKEEIERMLGSLDFPAKDKPASPSPAADSAAKAKTGQE